MPFNTKGVGDAEYVYLCENLLLPILREFQPELILISSGFDSAVDDPLGGFCITPQGYSYMTHALVSVCPRVLAVLEGGYNIEVIPHCAEAVIRSLQGEKPPFKNDPYSNGQTIKEMIANCKPKECARSTLIRVAKELEKYWQCI